MTTFACVSLFWIAMMLAFEAGMLISKGNYDADKESSSLSLGRNPFDGESD